ncbi:MAG: PQQ-binding-like beta-propeller repeat protein [Holosporaceae bacterium]
MRAAYLAPLALLLLFACSKKSGPPLKGKREPVLVTTVHSDQNQDNGTLPMRPLRLDPPQAVHAWPLANHSTQNALQHLYFGGLKQGLEQVWRFSEGSSFDARLTMPPIIVKDRLFFVSGEQRIYCLDLLTGKKLWSADMVYQETQDSPVWGGGCAFWRRSLFVTSPYGDIFCLSADNGKLMWHQKTTDLVRGAPLISRDNVFVLTLKNQLDVLEAKTGMPLWTHMGVPENVRFFGASMPAAQGADLVVCYSSGEVYKLSAKTGRVLWSFILSPDHAITELDSIPHIVASPVVYRGAVYVVAGSGKMVALDLASGNLLWERPYGGLETPVVSGSDLFMITTNALVRLDRQTGKTFWSTPLTKLRLAKDDKDEKTFWYGPLLINKTLYLLSQKGALWAVDAETGKPLQRVYHLNTTCSMRPIVAQNHLVVLTQGGTLYTFRAKTIDKKA